MATRVKINQWHAQLIRHGENLREYRGSIVLNEPWHTIVHGRLVLRQATADGKVNTFAIDALFNHSLLHPCVWEWSSSGAPAGELSGNAELGELGVDGVLHVEEGDCEAPPDAQVVNKHLRDAAMRARNYLTRNFDPLSEGARSIVDEIDAAVMHSGPDEFYFIESHGDPYRASLTYRCMSVEIVFNDPIEDNDRAFMQAVVDCLNEHFKDVPEMHER